VTEPVPASLLAALAALVNWLDSSRVRAMVIGGIAVSILGRPRLTRDIDALALIPESDWDAVLSAAKTYGMVPRLEDPLAFARRARMLLLRHSPSEIDVDLSLGGLSFEREALDRSQLHELGGIRLRLPCVEDLLIMKAFAHRPKDMEDVTGLLDMNPQADLELVRRWVREFSIATTMPDLLEDFEKLVARRNTKS